MTRKKKEKHETPLYNKYYQNNEKYKSKSHNNILHKHQLRMTNYKNKTDKITILKNKIRDTEQEIDKNENSKKVQELTQKMKDYKAELQILNCEDDMHYILHSAMILSEYNELDEKEKMLLSTSTLTNEQNMELNFICQTKRKLEDEYLTAFEPGYVTRKSLYNYNDVMCIDCRLPFVDDDGFATCESCGKCITTIEIYDTLSYKEIQNYDYRPQFTYIKETHLDDWLKRFQAKENRVIPQSILDQVILEARKSRITDLTTLTEDKVKRFLKKLGLNQYYDNVIGIINRINGRQPFTLTTELEDKIKLMFAQIQEPFERYKPANRVNFLSYGYTLHKFFKILGLHEFAYYFPLLKSPDKLRQQDDIFQKIVAEMATKDKSINWVFYPSI
jgi:hypothetical protein